jgi:serine/threonine protein kinase
VHCDLKPANFVLIKGVLKLIDFGISKALQDDTTNIQKDSQVNQMKCNKMTSTYYNQIDWHIQLHVTRELSRRRRNTGAGHCRKARMPKRYLGFGVYSLSHGIRSYAI